ncbi:MAG: hypothetical protein IIW25_00855, partial [Bacteroidales bacterium]|nr:hypothetical protein [Bacteroidales bacterium]
KVMKKIWYAIVETIEVPDNATDEEIDNIIAGIATQNGTLEEGKDYMWSDKDNLLYEGDQPW